MVTLYSTHCPRCNVLTKKLDLANIKYNLIEDQNEMIKMGFNTVPVLDVNGKIMNFTEAIKWLNAGGKDGD